MNELIIPTLIISCMAFFLAVLACIAFVAQRLSTHKIEWRPLVTEKVEQYAEEEQINVTEEDDKILNEALSLSRKKKKEIDPLEEILETANFRN